MAAGVQQTETNIETNVEALLKSVEQQGHAWLDAFVGKNAPAGKQLATAEARLYGPDGTLYAHATTTCLVFELKRPE